MNSETRDARSCCGSGLLATVVVAVVFVVFSEVCEGHVVAAVKPFTVFVAVLGGNGRLAEFSLLVQVVGTLFRDVSAGGLDAVVEASALDIAELLGRRIPWTALMVGRRTGLGHWLAFHALL